MSDHGKFKTNAEIAERYFRNMNDITRKKSPNNKGTTGSGDSPLRNADNRIPFNWHGFLVNQKASYMFTYPPAFDVGDKNVNEKITTILGDYYPKEAKTLCKDASNCGISWLHVWIDENNNFQYAHVDPKQIRPIYSSDLKQTLIAVLRVYDKMDDLGKEYTVYEYWTDKEVTAYRNDKGLSVITNLQEFTMFNQTDVDSGAETQVNSIPHNFGEVPFIEFLNNDIKTSDLENVKALIDTYDKIFSGFVNDVEDIQEVIFVLTNYGGTDLDEFLKSLKRYKTVDMQNSGSDDKSGLSTITIDIPVEARNILLEMTEKKIYVQGQGLDPNPEKFGDASGVALKYLYTLLELKAGLAETEFRTGFGKLVRMICKYLNYVPEKVGQTWTRNIIQNDLENAQIASQSKGIISDKSIYKNHTWVDDAEAEMEEIKAKEPEEVPPMFNTGGGS